MRRLLQMGACGYITRIQRLYNVIVGITYAISENYIE